MKDMFRAVNARRTGSSRRLRTALGAIALIVLTATAAGAISASAGRKADGRKAVHGSSAKIVGSWIATVNRGPSLPPIKSLQTYSKGGGLVTVQNNGATVASPAHGAWKRIGARKYASTFMFFRYDPGSGAYIGTTKLRCTLELAPNGKSLASVCSPEFRDPAGHLEPGSNIRRDPGTAERIKVEPIPHP